MVTALLLDKPFTQNHFGVLMHKSHPSLLRAVNAWMAGIKANGTMRQWEKKYIQ